MVRVILLFNVAFLVAFLLLPLSALAAEGDGEADGRPWLLGLEAQAYPAGGIGTLRLDLPLGDHLGLTLRAGYNGAFRQDFGAHDDERGGGAGASLGMLYSNSANAEGWGLGLRADYWRLNIAWSDQRRNRLDRVVGDEDWLFVALFAPAEWRNLHTLQGKRQGRTTIDVLQPTLELRYLFAASDTLLIGPSLSAGGEINVRTRGEGVGQGPILLFGLNVMLRL
ncbi:MAG: hypothetical protein K1X75_16415 [Leptospirales bacterium]|nr:hypothetical protein [Leptospirales bacterium]